MGRHAHVTTDPDVAADPARPADPAEPRRLAPPDGAPGAMLGWGVFTTLLAGVLAGWVGHGWASAGPVVGLGAGGTVLLWTTARAARRPVRRHARTREGGHRSGTTGGRSVKCPRDQRKR